MAPAADIYFQHLWSDALDGGALSYANCAAAKFRNISALGGARGINAAAAERGAGDLRRIGRPPNVKCDHDERARASGLAVYTGNGQARLSWISVVLSQCGARSGGSGADRTGRARDVCDHRRRPGSRKPARALGVPAGQRRVPKDGEVKGFWILDFGFWRRRRAVLSG